MKRFATIFLILLLAGCSIVFGILLEQHYSVQRAMRILPSLHTASRCAILRAHLETYQEGMAEWNNKLNECLSSLPKKCFDNLDKCISK